MESEIKNRKKLEWWSFGAREFFLKSKAIFFVKSFQNKINFSVLDFHFCFH